MFLINKKFYNIFRWHLVTDRKGISFIRKFSFLTGCFVYMDNKCCHITHEYDIATEEECGFINLVKAHKHFNAYVYYKESKNISPKPVLFLGYL